MTKYNNIQIEYRDKCKKKIQTELEISKSFGQFAYNVSLI